MLKKFFNYYYIYCLLLSFIVLLFTSCNSFFYSFNEWCDANAFFSVGKSIMNGIVPYKNLFEQKGIILFFIYGIGYLISNTSFYGVFLLEVISFSFFLYFIHKIITLYFEKKYSLLILPIISFIICTSSFFYYGGSCEEFCLPFISFSLYYYVKHFRISKLTNKESFVNGIMAGCVFMMKYTVLSFWICFIFFIFIDLIRGKTIRNAFIFICFFCLGFFVPIIICLIYLIVFGALNDFIFCYFIYNIFIYYKDIPSYYGFLEKISLLPSLFTYVLKHNKIYCMILTYLSPFSIVFLKRNLTSKNNLFFKVSLVFIVLFVFALDIWTLRFYPYYFIIFDIFSLFVILSIFNIIDKFIKKINNRFYFLLVIVVTLFFISMCYFNANFRNLIGKNRDYYYQFEFADYINQFDNPTLLNVDTLDSGVYTTSGIIPSTRFFHNYNIKYESYPEISNCVREYIENKTTMFIVIDTTLDRNNYDMLLTGKYNCVLSKDHINEYGELSHALLYMRTD